MPPTVPIGSVYSSLILVVVILWSPLRENSPIPRLMLFLQAGILDPVGSNLRACERLRDPRNQEGWICHRWST